MKKWTVKTINPDERQLHTLGRYTSYAGAKKKADAWLGGDACWQTPFRAIGYYGDVLTIEAPEGADLSLVPALPVEPADVVEPVDEAQLNCPQCDVPEYLCSCGYIAGLERGDWVRYV